MKLNDLDSAWIHLKQAESLNNSHEIEHTIVHWHLMHSYTKSLLEFWRVKNYD